MKEIINSSDSWTAINHLLPILPLIPDKVSASILLQVAIIYIPWLQDIFRTTSLSLDHWLLIAPGSIVPVLLINLINETIYKRIRSGVSY